MSELNLIVGHPFDVEELKSWLLFGKSSNPSIEWKYHEKMTMSNPFTIKYLVLDHDVYTINNYFINHSGPMAD